MFLQFVKQMAERECVTETRKAENQMEWVGRMNSIRSRPAEIVNNDLIYTFLRHLRQAEAFFVILFSMLSAFYLI